ncbi:MAG: chemotaxis response regulator protein-glutamate methylesterase [Myxococcaceae bacterium]|nr:chemotaxis response regulator protein-glutamate methylesterase [Myxococcaceae bacterium]
MASDPVRVLVVDDSAVVRRMLSDRLSREPGIEVVGTAPSPVFAWDRIKELRPDALTLDVEMPEMDGVSFLRILMRERPMPVVMVSSLTTRGAEATLDALESGAFDFVTKPGLGSTGELAVLIPEIAEKLRAATRARVRPRTAGPRPLASVARPAGSLTNTTEKVIAIGSSTGGTEAVREILERLPADSPGVVIVQHMPEAFTASWARRCNASSALEVSEARHGDRLLPGHALIAPGNQHLRLVRRGGQYHVALSQEPPYNRHRPSVDVLFHSVAEHAGRNALGVILTGMGADGAAGLLSMRQAGAFTCAQDEASCVVFGMPREAIALGAAAEVLPLEDIAARLVEGSGRPA